MKDQNTGELSHEQWLGLESAIYDGIKFQMQRDDENAERQAEKYRSLLELVSERVEESRMD